MAAPAPRFNDERFGDAIGAVRRFVYSGSCEALPAGWSWKDGAAVGYHYTIGLVMCPARVSYQFSVRRESYKMTEKHRQMVKAVCGNDAYLTSDYEMRHVDRLPITSAYALARTQNNRLLCPQFAHNNPAVAAAFAQRQQEEAPAEQERAARRAAAAAEVARRAAEDARWIAREEEESARHAAERRAAAAAARLAVETPQELMLEECVADCDDPQLYEPDPDPQPCEPESIPA